MNKRIKSFLALLLCVVLVTPAIPMAYADQSAEGVAGTPSTEVIEEGGETGEDVATGEETTGAVTDQVEPEAANAPLQALEQNPALSILGAPVMQPAGTFALQKEFSVKQGNDDAFVSASAVNLVDAALYLHGRIGAVDYTNYVRFVDVQLPADAVISNAYISFTTYAASTQTTQISVAGELGNGDAFSTAVSNFTNRTFTNPTPTMQTPVLAAGATYNTEDITAVLNQMRAANSNLTNYVFKIQGSATGSLLARSYNYSAAFAPKLVVEYYSSQGTYQASISDVWDDAEEYGTGKAMAAGDGMEIGGYFSTSLVPAYKEITGFRFPNVQIPANANITNAYLEFTTLGTTTADRVSNMVIRAQLGDAARYQATAGNISSRSYSSLAVRYQQSAFTAALQTVRTPNLKNIIDENRLNGWQSGQALAFMIDGDNYIGSIYQGATAYSPKLVIEYEYVNGNYGDNINQSSETMDNIFINEVAPAGNAADANPWLELYNANDYPVILGSGMYLGDEKSGLKGVELSNIFIPENSTRVVALPSGFNMSGSNTLTLSALKGGQVVALDTFVYKPVVAKEIRGRFTDGNEHIVKFVNGSHGMSNNDQAMEIYRSISHASGQYSDSIDVVINTDSANTIRYTLDGSTPTRDYGSIYSDFIRIYDGQTTLKVFIYNDRQDAGVQTYVYRIGVLPPEMQMITKEIPIRTGNDDAYANLSTVNLTSAYLYLNGNIGTVHYDNYLRFTGVNLPSDAVIENASIVFTTQEASTQPTSLTIAGELSEGASLGLAASTYLSRSFTNASEPMTTPALAANQQYRTEDISDLLYQMMESQEGRSDYVFKLTGNDSGRLVTRSYNYSAAAAPKLVISYYSRYNSTTTTIANAYDDAEEYGVAKAIAVGDGMEIGGYYSTTLTSAYKEIAGFRFPDVEIPANAVVTNAYIEFTTYATTTQGRYSNMVIRSELGNAARYQAVAGNISNRTYSQLTVRYQQAGFTSALQTVRTPNLKSIIDENRLYGWQSGQALAFMIDGDNYIGSVYQGTTAYSPKLVVEYEYTLTDAVESMIPIPTSLSSIYINEVAPQGTATDNTPWVELYNANDFPVVLSSGVSLGTPSEPNQMEFYRFLIPANGYRTVPATGVSLDSSILDLSVSRDNDWYAIDSFYLESVGYDETWGRLDDGERGYVKFRLGTPAASNETIDPAITFRISHGTGAYQEAFNVTLETDTVSTIIYTLDGNAPSPDYGMIYVEPIEIPADQITNLKVYVDNPRVAGGPYSYLYIVGQTELDMQAFSKDFAIQSGLDDGYANTATANLTDAALYLHGRVGATSYDNYLRFTGVNLPEDAVVTNAYIEFSTYAATQPTQITIAGEVGSGAAFSTVASSFQNRNFSAVSDPMTTPTLAAGQTYQTEGIAEIVNQMRSSAPSLTDFVFKIDGNEAGNLMARSYNYSATYAPRLHIEYFSGYGDVSKTITSYLDDAEEYGTAKAIAINETAMEIGGYFSATLTAPYKEVSGFRFPNIEIPEGAEITNAYIEFTTLGVAAAGRISNQSIRVELGDAAAYTTTAGNVSGRNYGNLAVTYQQSSFTAALQKVRTPNLRNLIDENRMNGWQSGQSLAFLVDGDNFIGSVYQGGTLYAPKLVVEYKFSNTGAYIDGAISDPALLANVYINEVSSEGSAGSKADWVEFYNANDVPVVLGDGIKLWRDTNKKEAYEFDNFIIPAGGYRIVYFDESPEDGSDHANFELKGNAELLLVSTAGGSERLIHNFKYASHMYNETYGLRSDGGPNIVLFARETFCASNNNGQEKYSLTVSHDRGVYPAAFMLQVSSKVGTTIKYTIDGTTPSATNGVLFTGSIPINESCMVKILAYDATGNSTVISYTYVLLDNYINEKYRFVTGVTSGYVWANKDKITAAQYATAMAEIPIVSVSSTTGQQLSLSTENYAQGTFEFLDTHLGGSNYTADIGIRRYGQASITQLNSNIAVRFHRNYNSTKAKYTFFTVGDNAGKFARLDLKEGQDGPQADVFNLGFLRYDESVTNMLAFQMNKVVALDTEYVHCFYNGQYMGVKTLVEHFNDNLAEDYIGGDSDDYTVISYQDASFQGGIVEPGDGIAALNTTVVNLAAAGNLQEFKRYVNLDDMIKTQILYMFIDCEREIDAIVHNEVLEGNGIKMIFNVNDTDGAFYNNGGTGTSMSGLTGGGGTYRYKWISDPISRMGAGRMFGNFSGNSTVATAGNLEFKTLVKDQVLELFGPATGDMLGAPGAPLSAANVRQVILDNQNALTNVYRLDAAYMSPTGSNMYDRWLAANTNVLNQVNDRVSFNLQMWKNYNMAHTLEKVQVVSSGGGITLSNPNAGTTVYYTLDGSDPMGANGVVSSSATAYTAGTVLPADANLTIRAFTTNNWGPLS